MWCAWNLGFDQDRVANVNTINICPQLSNKFTAVFFFSVWHFFGWASISVQSAFRQGKQEKSHSAAVHSSGHIHLTTQRAHFEGDILCVLWQAAQAEKIYCVCVYSRALLDDVGALTGRGQGFIPVEKYYLVDIFWQH